MRIVSIHAHPDDAEILAGGTLALLAKADHEITIVTMTPGDKGSDKLPPEKISEIRREEARGAAAIIGAKYICAEFRDLEIFSDHESRQRMVELVRRIQPEIVLTSAPSDYLCDHETTNALVRDALFAAPAPNYRTESRPLPSIPHLYFMDPIGGFDREYRWVKADFIVNITDVFETKKRMLARHKSQRDWLHRQHDMDDYIESMEEWSSDRGAEIGCKYGEGFRQYRGHPYPQTPLLQQLLCPR